MAQRPFSPSWLGVETAASRAASRQRCLFSPLACEWSCGDFTWHPVRNWSGSSGKRGSATLLLRLPIPSMHMATQTGRKYTGRPLSLFIHRRCASKCLFSFNIARQEERRHKNGLNSPSCEIVKPCDHQGLFQKSAHLLNPQSSIGIDFHASITCSAQICNTVQMWW